MDKIDNLSWRGLFHGHHTNFGPKSCHMAILEKMSESSRNCTIVLKMKQFIIHAPQLQLHVIYTLALVFDFPNWKI
jgi:hypothetical protein